MQILLGMRAGRLRSEVGPSESERSWGRSQAGSVPRPRQRKKPRQRRREKRRRPIARESSACRGLFKMRLTSSSLEEKKRREAEAKAEWEKDLLGAYFSTIFQCFVFDDILFYSIYSS